MIKRNMTEARFAASQLYIDIVTACEKALLFEGEFEKLKIMRECKNEALVDEMRWDWIVKKLSGGHDMPGGKVELIPVAESFFKAKAREKALMKTDLVFPGKYVAQGYGKRIAGWVLGTFAGGRFALYKVDLSRKQIEGKTRSLRDFADNTTKKLVANGEPGKVTQIRQIAGLPQPKAVKGK